MSTRLTELQAQITGDTTNVVAALEKTKRAVQDVGRSAQSSSASASTAFDKLGDKADKVANSASAILNSLYALEAQGSARVLALGNAFGSVAGLLGPQGKLVQGVAIVGSAIVALFLQAKEKSAEATKAIREDIEQLVNAQDFASLTKKIRELDQGTAGKNFQDGRVAIQQRIDALVEEANVVGKSSRYYLERQKKIVEERKALAAVTAQVNTYRTALESTENVQRAVAAPLPITSRADSNEKRISDAKALEERLTTLRKKVEDLNDTFSQSSPAEKAQTDLRQLVAEYERAGIPVTRLREQLEQLTADVDANGQQSDATKAKIAAIGAEYGKYLEPIRELREKQEKLFGKEITAKAVQFLKVLEDLNDVTAKQNAIDIGRKEARDAANETTRRAIANADAEITALLAGSDAYDTFLRKQAQDIAAQEIVNRARAEGRQATAQELIDARTNAAYLFDAAQLAAQLQAALQDTGAGKLANELGDVAERATQIATSLGEAGRNIARVAAIAGPLFKGLGSLQQGLVARDGKGSPLKGQSVGLLSALGGSNGKESQAQAIGGALSIIGAVATVADALDVFGTRSRQRAEEMREAAKAFNLALAEFVVSTRTTLEQALRENVSNASELANKGAAAFGLKGTQNFGSLDALQAQIATLRTGAPVFRALADELEKVLVAARANEAELKRQNDEEIARLNDNLEVRRLAASGLTDEADALRDRLGLDEEILALQEKYGSAVDDYIAQLRVVTAAEQAAAFAAKVRAAALSLLDDQLSILGGTPIEQLGRTIDGLTSIIPGIAGIADGLSLNTQDGLVALRERLRDLFRAISADGISADEQPLVDAIKRILGLVDSAAGSLPPALDAFSAALEAFKVKVEVFGLSAADQLDGLATIFAGKFSALDEILAGADFTSADGLSALKAKIGDAIASILSDGKITDEERPFLEALQQFFGLINGALDDATSAAEQAIADAAAAREKARTASGNRVAIFDLEGVDAVKATLEGFGTSFAALFGEFDLTTLQGIEDAKAALRGVFNEIDGLTDEQIVEKFGMTRDEVIAALLDTDRGLDGLSDSLKSVAEQAAAAAQAAADFAESVSQDFLRSQGKNQEADLNAAKSKRDARIAQAVKLGLGQDILDQIEAIYQGDVAEIIARYAAQVPTGALIPTVTSPSAGGAGVSPAGEASTRSRPRSSTIVGDFGGLSEVTGQSLAGRLGEIAFNTGRDGAIVRALSGGSYPIPSLASAGIGALPASGGGGVNIGTITVTLSGLDIAGRSPEDAGMLAGRAIAKELGKIAVAHVKFLGSGKL